MMVREGLESLQRQAQGGRGGRPAKAMREDALALCSACGWIKRAAPRAITTKQSPLIEQQFVWDAAHTHGTEAHGIEPESLDCDEVRERLGVPEPSFYPQAYLRCTTRLYLIGEDALRDAYHEHWDRCPATEALRRIAEHRTKEAPSMTQGWAVLTHGRPLFPWWKHVP